MLITSKSSHEKWIVPGGGVNLGETAEDAVLREAYEEAGVVCDNVEYLGVVDVIFEVEFAYIKQTRMIYTLNYAGRKVKETHRRFSFECCRRAG